MSGRTNLFEMSYSWVDCGFDSVEITCLLQIPLNVFNMVLFLGMSDESFLLISFKHGLFVTKGEDLVLKR